MYAYCVLQVASGLPDCAWHTELCVHASQLAPCQPGLHAVHCAVVPFWHTPMSARSAAPAHPRRRPKVPLLVP